MAETRTDRLGLVVYSEGSDSPSRVDWNESMQQIELWGSRDEGTARDSTAQATQKIRRFLSRDWGAAPTWAPAGSPRLRTLYRTDDDLVDWPMGGPTHPRVQDFRALEGQGIGTAAWRISHPDRPDAPTGVLGYDGGGRLAGRLSLHDPTNPTPANSKAALHIGSHEAANPTALGRAYIRTVAAGEYGVVVQPHDANAAAALAVREPGGTDQFWVDSTGRVRGKGAVALGGSELAGDVLNRSLTVSPSTSSVGPGGMVVHGRSTRAEVDPFVVRRFESTSAADRVLMRIGTRDVAIGAADHPDADARLRLAAPLTLGQGGFQWDLASADAAAVLGEFSGSARRFGLDASRFYSTLPGLFENRARTADVPMVVRAYTSGNAVPAQSLQEWRAVRPGVSPESKPLAYVDGQGRIVGNVPHRGGGGDRPTALRDVRQPLEHFTYVRWVLPGHFGLFRGVRIDPGDREYQHVFPEMTVRSATATQLKWWMRLEALTYAANPPFQGLDRVVINLHFKVSVNGGAFVRVEAPGWEQESVGMTTSPVAWCPGDSTSWPGFWSSLLNPGDKFKIAFVARNSDGLGPIRLRRADMWVTENVFDMYDPPFQPEGYNMSDAQRQAQWWAPS
jgi:hypothetical protein